MHTVWIHGYLLITHVVYAKHRFAANRKYCLSIVINVYFHSFHYKCAFGKKRFLMFYCMCILIKNRLFPVDFIECIIGETQTFAKKSMEYEHNIKHQRYKVKVLRHQTCSPPDKSQTNIPDNLLNDGTRNDK